MKRINEKYAEINDLKALLASTDYHVIKEAEGDYNVPQEILDERQDARARINVLEAEIEMLEEEKRAHIETIDEIEDEITFS